MASFVFRNPHLSIKQFPPIDLPQFALITGPNGGGKTHLLQAIAAGHIITEGVSTDQIQSIDWNLAPRDEGETPSTAASERGRLTALFRRALPEALDILQQRLLPQGFPADVLNDPARLAAMTAQDFDDAGLADGLSRVEQAKVALKKASNKLIQLVGKSGQPFAENLQRIAATHQTHAVALKIEHLVDALPSWGSASLFQQSLGSVFVAYRDLYLHNKLARLDKADGKDVVAFSDREFFERFKVPPWDFVNRAFDRAHLDFMIDRPVANQFWPYTPRVTKKSTGVEIPFSNLSSGEKVIMSFALCLYHAEDKRQLTKYPKILLLDEADALLHPSMSRFLLSTITDTLVAEHQIQVIATTHSPTTVALAPDESVYLKAADAPGLVKITKARALNILTSDVPTISLAYEGRRQVLVESPFDAKLYDALFQRLKKHLDTERSLTFLETSPKGRAGTNGGREVVQRLVTELAANGNSSIFGLIDWDGENAASGRVFVLAEGARNGLENVLLDPLLLAAVIVLDIPPLRSKIGVDDALTYVSFCGMTLAELQQVVDAVQMMVLGKKLTGTKATAKYLGGFELSIDQAFLQMDDHDLGEAVVAVPQINVVAKGKVYELMQTIVSKVLRESIHFTPSEIPIAFKQILDAPSHG